MLKLGEFAVVVGEVTDVDPSHNSIRVQSGSQRYVVKYLEHQVQQITEKTGDLKFAQGLTVKIAGTISHNKVINASSIALSTPSTADSIDRLQLLCTKIMGAMGL